ncbi:ABC-type transport system, permease and ATP-binding components [Alteracholeplasma palmae J233]|uniref:ABC-type transport system, permease and ATP-binding components n=1 Tax=Alteracholeplasma palmae (strain ATCC 49389 / J233) TaxID=1318466 RepID=U4KS02_ALTPJ|nr:ABC transporter ATP-binding protein [Alteracholeplasma palmae]CCV64596.1 ABC-type transport system, permease and ATP-binding components [Alteracholeplasma palmae J233]
MNRLQNSKKAPKGTFKRLLKQIISLHKYRLLFVVVCMILSTLANIGATYTIQYVIDAASRINKQSADFTEVINLIITMVALYLTSIALAIVYLRMMIDIAQDTLTDLRDKLFKKMMGLPLRYFDTNSHGDLMSRFTNDVDATRQMISQSLPQIIVSTLTIIGYLTAMVITSWILSLVTLILTSVIFFVVKRINSNSRKYYRNQQTAIGKVNGYVEEMIEGQKVVKVFNHEKKAAADFSKLNDELYENAKNASMKSGILIPITLNLGYLTFALVSAFGAYLYTKDLLAVPALVGFLLFVRQFTGPINQLSQQMNFVNMALSGAARIFDVLDEENEVNEGKVILVQATYDNNQLVETTEATNTWAFKDLKENKLIKLSGDVRFKDVDFSYNPNKKILKKVSLYAKPGQKIAFVGATGAGKTTITNLINRFYDIDNGEITFDGINVKNIEKSSLRKSLGIVLQDTDLFTGTIFDNIRYGKLDATNDEIIQAAKLANADEFITKLPLGYETVITDNGQNLSSGQRQLLSIARVAVANPPVLILDEATSSIDTHTEKLIQNGMDELMKGRTVFVIAHRLSTIKNSNAIIVLDSGEIIERGNHDELIEQKGKYYQLYTGAFELE